MTNGGPSMNSIETSLSARLSGELFDEVLVRLASARQARGAPAYFLKVREERPTTYFSPPAVSAMGSADFELPGDGTAERLVEALAAFWERSGESDLCSLIPMMRKIAAALQDEAVENDGTVSVFCYAMF